jgi:hypothetical protein
VSIRGGRILIGCGRNAAGLNEGKAKPRGAQNNQAGRYINSNRWNVEVFWHAGHVRLWPPSGNSGLRGHSGSNGTARDLGGIALWLKTMKQAGQERTQCDVLGSGKGADAIVTQTLTLLLAEAHTANC